jgi:single-stranded DNA-specific DHH superfamily exonuclease
VDSTCFYHAGCPDGFGAAWAVWRRLGDGARYVPRGHEDSSDAHSFEGQRVVFVDIAPNNQTLRALGDVADQVIVLDHHVSSRDRFAADPSLENVLHMRGHHVCFDLDHSGAVLAWLYFHPNAPTPELLRYVEDQDLWNWKLPYSDQVNAALASYPRDFEVWDQLAARPIEELAREGEPIVRANRMDVERSLKSAHPIAIGTRRIEAVNAQHLRSAIGHELAKRAAYGEPWGIVYRITGRRVDASIYSIGDLDVAEVATGLGGGGHRNAAGFSVSLERWLADFA